MTRHILRAEPGATAASSARELPAEPDTVNAASRVLVAGIGNAYGGDDAVGLEVVRALAGRVPPGVSVREVAGDPTDLIELWEGVALVILVDAMRSGRAPGSVVRIDLHDPAGEDAAPGGALRSSHAFGVLEVVALARRLGQLPPALVAYGVEGAEFSPGCPLSAPVAGAVPALVAALLRELPAAL